MPLALADNVAQPPADHVAQFVGDYPCHADGREISEMRLGEVDFTVGGFAAKWSFSAKPKPADKYANFYDKVLADVDRFCSNDSVIVKDVALTVSR